MGATAFWLGQGAPFDANRVQLEPGGAVSWARSSATFDVALAAPSACLFTGGSAATLYRERVGEAAASPELLCPTPASAIASVARDIDGAPVIVFGMDDSTVVLGRAGTIGELVRCGLADADRPAVVRVIDGRPTGVAVDDSFVHCLEDGAANGKLLRRPKT